MHWYEQVPTTSGKSESHIVPVALIVNPGEHTFTHSFAWNKLIQLKQLSIDGPKHVLQVKWQG